MSSDYAIVARGLHQPMRRWWRCTGIWLLLLLFLLTLGLGLYQYSQVLFGRPMPVNLVALSLPIGRWLPLIIWAMAVTQVEQTWRNLVAASPLQDSMFAARYRYMLFHLVPFVLAMFGVRLLLNALTLSNAIKFGNPLPLGWEIGNAVMYAVIPLGLIAVFAAFCVVNSVGIRLGWILIGAEVLGTALAGLLRHFFPFRPGGEHAQGILLPLAWLTSLIIICSLLISLRLYIPRIARPLIIWLLAGLMLSSPISTVNFHYHSLTTYFASAVVSLPSVALSVFPFNTFALSNWVEQHSPSQTWVWYPLAALNLMTYPLYFICLAWLFGYLLVLLERHEVRLRAATFSRPKGQLNPSQ